MAEADGQFVVVARRAHRGRHERAVELDRHRLLDDDVVRAAGPTVTIDPGDENRLRTPAGHRPEAIDVPSRHRSAGGASVATWRAPAPSPNGNRGGHHAEQQSDPCRRSRRHGSAHDRRPGQRHSRRRHRDPRHFARLRLVAARDGLHDRPPSPDATSTRPSRWRWSSPARSSRRPLPSTSSAS